jgi:hypothetical protein
MLCALIEVPMLFSIGAVPEVIYETGDVKIREGIKGSQIAVRGNTQGFVDGVNGRAFREVEFAFRVRPFADRAFLVGSAQARTAPGARVKHDAGVALIHVVLNAAALLPFMPVLGSHVHRDVSILL